MTFSLDHAPLLLGLLLLSSLVGWLRWKWVQRARSALADLEQRSAALVEAHADDWLPASTLQAWAATQVATTLPSTATTRRLQRCLGAAEAARMAAARAVLEDPGGWVAARNAEWLAETLAREQHWFSTVLSHPLHPDQQRAIVINEDHTLVVAGAGTGKTATLAARVAWLVQKRCVPMQEVLALAYNRAAATELRERLVALGLQDVDVLTFHALGNRLLREAAGHQAPLTPLATDDRQRGRFFDAQVVALLQAQDDLQPAVLRWFSEQFQEDDQPTPSSHAEYIAQETRRERRTLTGQRLRSQQEVYIANWLTLNGIQWEYERPYAPDGVQPGARLYRPDFYLSEHDLWLEHWGITRDGRGRPGLDVDRYQKQRDWKRALHRKCGTTLLETWSEDIGPGTTHPTLQHLMKTHDVPLRRLRSEEVDALVAAGHGPTTRLARVLGQFLLLFRGRGASFSGLFERARGPRDRLFLRLFAPVYKAWQDQLQKDGQIDFDDMLVGGARAVRDGQVRPPWRYLLVDELQDASVSRLVLVESLRDAMGGARVTGVGDDWQSIYRFAGADVSAFAGLSSRWTGIEHTPLRQTWRLTRPGLEVSGRFVSKNPGQSRKSLLHRPGALRDPVVVVWSTAEREQESVCETLVDIAQRSPGGRVLLLSRYNRAVRADAIRPYLAAAKRLGLTLDARTVHRAKGLEADHVVVLGLRSHNGFPCTVADDPVLAMVQAAPDPFPFAEERRLFYVALSRARRSTWLITPDADPSPFVEELLTEDAETGWVEQRGNRTPAYRCPACEQTSVVLKTSNRGTFWGCRHHPVCDGQLSPCPTCGEGPVVLQERGSWRCTRCEAVAPPCPRCGVGHLVQKTGRHGPFLGCSAWGRFDDGCHYSRDGTLHGAWTGQLDLLQPASAHPPTPPAPVRQSVQASFPTRTRPSQREFADPAVLWGQLGPLTFLDVETTRAASGPVVIEIAALRYEDGEEVDRLITLVNPCGIEIQQTRVHGLSAQHLTGAPSWPALFPALRRVLEGTTMVAHSVSVEEKALRATLERAGGTWDGPRLCTLRLARLAHPERSGRGAHTLQGLLALHGINREGNPHEAYADAAVLPALLLALLRRAHNKHERGIWLQRARIPGGACAWPSPAGDNPWGMKRRR